MSERAKTNSKARRARGKQMQNEAAASVPENGRVVNLKYELTMARTKIKQLEYEVQRLRGINNDTMRNQKQIDQTEDRIAARFERQYGEQLQNYGDMLAWFEQLFLENYRHRCRIQMARHYQSNGIDSDCAELPRDLRVAAWPLAAIDHIQANTAEYVKQIDDEIMMDLKLTYGCRFERLTANDVHVFESDHRRDTQLNLLSGEAA